MFTALMFRCARVALFADVEPFSVSTYSIGVCCLLYKRRYLKPATCIEQQFTCQSELFHALKVSDWTVISLVLPFIACLRNIHMMCVSYSKPVFW